VQEKAGSRQRRSGQGHASSGNGLVDGPLPPELQALIDRLTEGNPLNGYLTRS